MEAKVVYYVNSNIGGTNIPPITIHDIENIKTVALPKINISAFLDSPSENMVVDGFDFIQDIWWYIHTSGVNPEPTTWADLFPNQVPIQILKDIARKISKVPEKVSDADFSTFIVMLFKRGRLNQEHIDLFITPASLEECRGTVFTHSSFDSVINYELNELVGDGIINSYIIQHLRKRFPRIKSIKWLTRMKHNLASGKELARMCRAEGLEKFVRFGPEIEIIKNKQLNLDLNFDYLSILEDVMEAFTAWVVGRIEATGKSHGVAIQVIHNILDTFFNAKEISLRYEDVFDPISRLKEMYEAKNKGWKWTYRDGETIKATKIKDGSFKAEAYGWPKGDKKQEDQNKVLLCVEHSYDKDDARQKAAIKAIKVLDTTYGIKDFPSDPYE